jgi:prepilin-type processing-associated H-X9-DG protein
LLLVLTTMYWTSNSDSSQTRRQQACQKNLQKIFVAMEIYANDQAGKFPALAAARTAEEPLDLLVPRYTVDTDVFTCPGSPDPVLRAGDSLLKGKISYAYCMGRRAADPQEVLMSDRQVDTNSKTAGQNVFSSSGKPPGNNHSKHGGNFLFSDGHAEHSPVRAPFSIILTQGVVLLNPK